MSSAVPHPSVQLAWALANEEALAAGSRLIEPAHFLVATLRIVDPEALSTLEGSPFDSRARDEVVADVKVARELLSLSDEGLRVARRSLRRALQKGHAPLESQRLHRSLACRTLLVRAARAAQLKGAAHFGMADLLNALLEDLPEKAHPFLASQARGPQPVEVEHEAEDPHGGEPSAARDVFGGLGRDLTEVARKHGLPPVVGRKREITMLARFLHRTAKRNVIVVGDAGVGKTAIVEGLAQRIADGNLPGRLKSLRIVQLNVADITAGAKYVGELEERVQALLQDAKENPDVVLFLDEVHLVMGAGRGGRSAMDVANLLKPALARDDMRCIGATTTEEYERYVRDDPAFLRRFQLLRVAEPSAEDALVICESWARRIEEIQVVQFTPEAVQAAVDLSSRFIQGRALPDKAIDLLENAAAFEKVSTLTEKSAVPSKTAPVISPDTVREVLEEQYGISVAAGDALDVMSAEAALRAAVVGQDAALASIGSGLRALSRRVSPAKPLGVMLFLGPSGVGKTLAAEVLASALFPGSAATLGRFNMSELKERHELSRLIGSPPGFVGHDSQGALFRYAETAPQGLILLDEIDKAHIEIQDYFLQIFDKAEARDQKGRPVSFRRHLFVLTCNEGGRGPRERIGFEAAAEPPARLEGEATATLRQLGLREEFLGRLDCIVTFGPLGHDSLRALADRLLSGLLEEVANEHTVECQILEDVRAQLLDHCAAAGPSARGVIRRFESSTREPILSFLEGSREEHAAASIVWKAGAAVAAWIS